MVSQGLTTVDVSINTPDHSRIGSMFTQLPSTSRHTVGSELRYLLVNEEVFPLPFLENKLLTGRKAEEVSYIWVEAMMKESKTNSLHCSSEIC